MLLPRRFSFSCCYPEDLAFHVVTQDLAFDSVFSDFSQIFSVANGLLCSDFFRFSPSLTVWFTQIFLRFSPWLTVWVYASLPSFPCSACPFSVLRKWSGIE